jgi:hypothetical protein
MVGRACSHQDGLGDIDTRHGRFIAHPTDGRLLRNS